MKKFFFIALALTLSYVGAFAQGAIRLTNLGSGANGSVNARVFNVDGTSPLAGTGFSIQLYAGTSADSLSAVGSAVTFNTGGFAGYTATSPTLTVNGIGIGSQAVVQFRAWDNAGGTITTWEAAGIRGLSGTTTVTLGDPFNAASLPVAAGLTSFALIPEPSTYALGALGVGALLAFRRRKV